MVRPFEKDIDHIPGYVYPFDLYFLKNVPQEVFVEEAQFLQKHLTDAKIKEALEKWPQNLVELNGLEIAEKLKHRRNNLVDYAKEFSREIKEGKLPEGPLKGSEDLVLPAHLQKCFDCK